MDSKRKANGNATPDDDRAKRRKLTDEYDLTKGESRESTSAYGLAFLEQIRRTSDKSGRRVAGYFEILPPREGNEEYYKRTRMPISVEMIEQKLQNGEFNNMTELESYFKRMICNAKDYFPRTSSTFDDAERVRKAVSNYMTKTNPAYQTRGYQAFATPLPPEDGQSVEEQPDQDEVKDQEERGQDEDEEEDDDEDEGDDNDSDASPKKRSIILKRRGPGRPFKNPALNSQDTPRKSSVRPDHEYEGKEYKGLNFQQAQEKIVEEMLRHTDPEYEGAYFESFINLPPRALKDYYKMITEPLSLKKLQKAVRGQHGRNDPTGVSEFKSWAQFDEKAQLLWKNAYYYNEEGSEIYAIAQALEKFFYDQMKQAAAVVNEPQQPKIKLKVGQPAEQPGSTRKITINVGAGRGASVDSPAPPTGQSAASSSVNGTPAMHTQMTLAPLENARSLSASIPPPSPSAQSGVKGEEATSAPQVARPPSAAPGQFTSGISRPPFQPVQHQPQPYVPPVPTTPMEQKRLRGPGKGLKHALISSLRLYTSNQNNQSERPLTAIISPDPKEMQQSATINLPATHNRITITTLLPDFLQDRQYSLWAMMDRQALKSSYQQLPNQHSQERVFDAHLHPGLNMIETHLVAAIPRSERVPGGPEIELEVFTVFVNVMRN